MNPGENITIRLELENKNTTLDYDVEIGIELDLCEIIEGDKEDTKYKLNMNIISRNSQNAYFNRLKSIDEYTGSRKIQPKKTLPDYF